ncbi:hydroxymethylbilane synthase [Allonocardiopsis opalescens]|uniref:Porphobilinogen deaminase n=1 Tax=Allonocardiopsis opalescens TaxID=1144618 RepID=A0A2T0Q7X2_9ACTN|nr:hydroxymethylbilane synthase [Allonocardiopsis opalescens]PRX99882.1 hydroxymethylbilane synthase [Allonocardiopsis opalescens]
MSPTHRPGGPPLRLGTRRSLMATTQSQAVADALTERTGAAVELVGVTTYGDVTTTHLAQLGGTGVFVSALRDKLLADEIDFAVHSLKDLPTAAPEGLALAAVPARDDHRDALCARGGADLTALPPGARVGTGAPRRVAQLAAIRPDLAYVPIRGNADTRLGKVASGELDAVVLAHAGLRRIGRLAEVTEVLDDDRMLPAPGQGALAVECRADRPDLVELLGALDDPATRRAVTAERTVLAVLEAGCSAPVGAYASESGGRLDLRAAVIAVDGTDRVRMEMSADVGSAAELGRALAERMLERGADALMGGKPR